MFTGFEQRLAYIQLLFTVFQELPTLSEIFKHFNTNGRIFKIGVTSIHPGCIGTSIIQSARVDSEDSRSEVQGLFDRAGASPDVVARAIVRGIERNKLRVRVRPESVATEWLKRLLPVGIHHLISRRWQHENEPQERSSA